MEADWAKWVGRNRALKNADEEIDFQTDYVLDIVRCMQIMMNMMMVTKFCYGSFLKVSYLKVSFSIMTKIQRDCGSDFPWDLDVGDMFKVLFLYPSPGWKPAQSCLNFLKKFVLFCQEWHHHKDEDILTYRDKSFASKFTGESSFTANIRTLSLCRHPVHCPSLCVFVSFLMFVCLPINIYDSSLFAGTQSSVHHIVCLFLCLFLFVCLFVD